ncbi:hypothetical protein EVAR_66912_1 [Eumeta japonica]|uniref:Uncharacterized protein n=1 Tax=Eumeta variegata TaxID=151549 RepID=A0A4C1Z7R6_EUMVA|nr:hypothetical protein EVAR_66912_1 [Eumeta japonica]
MEKRGMKVNFSETKVMVFEENGLLMRYTDRSCQIIKHVALFLVRPSAAPAGVLSRLPRSLPLRRPPRPAAARPSPSHFFSAPRAISGNRGFLGDVGTPPGPAESRIALGERPDSKRERDWVTSRAVCCAAIPTYQQF